MTASPRDDGGVRDIAVIGAGPVGLSAAFCAGMREASVRVVDALPEIGGQLTALYPEKRIHDMHVPYSLGAVHGNGVVEGQP